MGMTVGEARTEALREKLANSQINSNLSKRENFAKHAMGGLLASGMEDIVEVARMSVLLADELTKALKNSNISDED